MVIFYSYVKLPEGMAFNSYKWGYNDKNHLFI